MARSGDEGKTPRARDLARRSLRELIVEERRRAKFHIDLISRREPNASPDRVARLVIDRWTQVARVEGGLTGAMGFWGVPLHLVSFLYCQVAVIVSVAEAYGTPLEGERGEDELLRILGRLHGVDDVLRSSPRLLGALAKTIGVRRGFGVLGRLIPLVAAPIAVRLNERDMGRVGTEALRRFGNVIQAPK